MPTCEEGKGEEEEHGDLSPLVRGFKGEGGHTGRSGERRGDHGRKRRQGSSLLYCNQKANAKSTRKPYIGPWMSKTDWGLLFLMIIIPTYSQSRLENPYIKLSLKSKNLEKMGWHVAVRIVSHKNSNGGFPMEDTWRPASHHWN